MIIVIFFSLLIFLCIINSSNLFFLNILNTLHIWLYNVYPSIFTFYLISNALLKTNVLKKCSIILHPFFSFEYSKSYELLLVSFFIGNPGTTSLIMQEYKQQHISLNDTKKLIYLSLFMNPLFLISCIGIKYALFIILTQIIICFITNKFMKYEIKINISNNELFNLSCFLDSIYNVMQLLMQIVGIMVFSNIIKFALQNFINIFDIKLLKNISTILFSTIEISSGIFDIKNLNYSNLFTMPFITFLVTFQGISIFLQQLIILKDINISYFKIFLIRLLQAISCSIIIYLLIILL